MSDQTHHGIIHFTTNRAVFFQSHYWHAPEWIPRSQCFIMQWPESSEVTVKLGNWIATQIGVTETSELKNAPEDKE